jgi:hypothetical protein
VQGEPIQDLGSDETAFYHAQGRMISYLTVTESGTETGGAHSRPPAGETMTYASEGCLVTYDRIGFDPETGTAMVNVTVTDDGGCEDITLSFVGYELPGGTTYFEKERASEQELVGAATVTLSPGDDQLLVVGLDGGQSFAISNGSG